MSEPVIELKNLTKTYGKNRGVNNINLSVPKGVVFGFLGPNGAGKTTTIGMLIDLLKPTSGAAKIMGLEVKSRSLDIRKRIGFLAGDTSLDDRLTGWQQVEYFSRIHGTFDKSYVQELAARLNSDLTRKIKTLSRGNKQKVGLITALAHKPELLILDEPTSGLDPLMQAEFNKIILEHKAAGNTTFISSHILSEIQEICDHVAFIREGELIASQSVNQLTQDLPRELKITSDDIKLVKALKALAGITKLTNSLGSIQCTYVGSVQPLLTTLAEHKIEDFTLQRAELESVFMKYYGEQSDVSLSTS